jgi:hypothetical protein
MELSWVLTRFAKSSSDRFWFRSLLVLASMAVAPLSTEHPAIRSLFLATNQGWS